MTIKCFFKHRYHRILVFWAPLLLFSCHNHNKCHLANAPPTKIQPPLSNPLLRPTFASNDPLTNSPTHCRSHPDRRKAVETSSRFWGKTSSLGKKSSSWKSASSTTSTTKNWNCWSSRWKNWGRMSKINNNNSTKPPSKSISWKERTQL